MFQAAGDSPAGRGLPADLKARAAAADTPGEHLQTPESLTQSCGDGAAGSIPSGGGGRPGLCLCAKDPEGRGADAAAAAARFHEAQRKNRMAWRGRRSAHAGRRGEGIALASRAMVLRDVRQKPGVFGCFTGFRGGCGFEGVLSDAGLVTNRQGRFARGRSGFGAGPMTR